MQNDIRQEVEKLMNQARWQEALELLDSQRNNVDLVDLRMKVEKHISETQVYIEKYIQDHRGRYTEASIFDKLINAGYRDSDVRTAFEKLKLDTGDKEKPTATKPVYTSFNMVSANPIGFLLFFPLIPMLVYFCLVIDYNFWSFLPWFYLIVFLFGTFFPMTIKQRYPEIAKGMIYGFRTLLVIFLVLPIVAVGVVWGICLLTGATI